MTRWSVVALVIVLSLALFTCLGCEGPPEASAESQTTCAHMSERNDAQCAAAIEGCSESCLHAKNKTELASDEGEGCPHAAKAECISAHAAAGEDKDGSTKSGCTCPHADKEGCPRARAKTAGEDASEKHTGCPYDGASRSDQDAGSS